MTLPSHNRLFRILPWRLQRALRSLRQPLLEELPDVPDLFHLYRELAAHPELERKPGGWLYRGEFYPDYLTVGGAGHAIVRVARRFCSGTGVDLGAGLWPFPGSTPVDVWRGEGAGRSLADFAPASLDYVFSSHCLEHVAEWEELLAAAVDRLKPGGHCFLYLPHPSCEIWHPGSPFVGNGHVWMPRHATIETALADRCGLEVIARDDGPDAMQSFYLCARKP